VLTPSPDRGLVLGRDRHRRVRPRRGGAPLSATATRYWMNSCRRSHTALTGHWPWCSLIAEGVQYRQHVLADCIAQSGVVRDLYDVAVEAIAAERRAFRFLLRDSPDTILSRSRQVMGLRCRPPGRGWQDRAIVLDRRH